ncbi:hypothetical protein L596_018704 [Steinernema carpocapsae]|uniref:Uncharacterized protein n=1 Tax=Steinernema carpocapsae TaxID=34508 RepID=A0A4U5N663_STECR|nr:hypothetical protein L596_018704 [Steinernema carpocapsae]
MGERNLNVADDEETIEGVYEHERHRGHPRRTGEDGDEVLAGRVEHRVEHVEELHDEVPCELQQFQDSDLAHDQELHVAPLALESFFDDDDDDDDDDTVEDEGKDGTGGEDEGGENPLPFFMVRQSEDADVLGGIEESTTREKRIQDGLAVRTRAEFSWTFARGIRTLIVGHSTNYRIMKIYVVNKQVGGSISGVGKGIDPNYINRFDVSHLIAFTELLFCLWETSN